MCQNSTTFLTLRVFVSTLGSSSVLTAWVWVIKGPEGMMLVPGAMRYEPWLKRGYNAPSAHA